jgi:regulator of protease activity HflC (stomatin/prohibitin superfamily)
MTLTGLVFASVLVMVGLSVLWRRQHCFVPEDAAAVTTDSYGFVRRLLPAGRHWLRPMERVEFTLVTKTRLTSDRAVAVATQDGILLTVNWSATFSLKPDLITENRSQRLRGLPNAEKTIARQVDIFLRRLLGSHTLRDLFNPATRNRLERHLNQLLADHLKSQGIAFNSLNLQGIDLPKEVAEALNKAKAIETLDQTIRLLDPTTRAVVQGAYQLDEMLHWDAYLPALSRLALKQQAIIAQ